MSVLKIMQIGVRKENGKDVATFQALTDTTPEEHAEQERLSVALESLVIQSMQRCLNNLQVAQVIQSLHIHAQQMLTEAITKIASDNGMTVESAKILSEEEAFPEETNDPKTTIH